MLARFFRRPEAVLEAARHASGAEAARLLLPLARAGHARAQAEIGLILMAAEGVEPDDGAAAKWLIAAAVQGDAVGQRGLGLAYLDGRGVPVDPVTAHTFLTRAAVQGDALAQDAVSELSETGRETVRPDPAAARFWAEAAAAQGVARAMTRAGRLANDAVDQPRDPARAAAFWRQAAGLGEPDAQALLGAAICLGQDCARDPVTGLAWLLRARAAGSAMAGTYLAGARRNLSEAEQAEATRLSQLPLDGMPA